MANSNEHVLAVYAVDNSFKKIALVFFFLQQIRPRKRWIKSAKDQFWHDDDDDDSGGGSGGGGGDGKKMTVN